jgi:hypothetical protein
MAKNGSLLQRYRHGYHIPTLQITIKNNFFQVFTFLYSFFSELVSRSNFSINFEIIF